MITVNSICDILNQALDADPEGIEKLFKCRVSINEELAEHPTIQVGADYTLSVIGLINGLLGESKELICTTWDEDEEKLTGFNVVKYETMFVD